MHSFTRPLCHTPRWGILVNFGLCLVFATLSLSFPNLRLLFLVMAAIFAFGFCLFLILLFLKPKTRIDISKESLSVSSITGRKEMAFADIISALLQPDFEAQNQLRLDITEKNGSSLCIDSRFIPDTECEVLTIIDAKLRAHGIAIERKQ
jgi:hypothetical protein